MNKIIKIAIMLIAYSVPISTLAMDCISNSIECKQMQAIEKAGIQQTKVVEMAPATEPGRGVSKKPPPEPFKIPVPKYSQPQKSEDSPKTVQKPEEPKKTTPVFNIFGPQQEIKEEKEPEPEFKFTPPKPPLQPIIKGSTVIKYQ